MTFDQRSRVLDDRRKGHKGDMPQLVHAWLDLLRTLLEAPSRWITELMDEADAAWDTSDPLLSGD